MSLCSSCTLTFPTAEELQSHKQTTHIGSVDFKLGGRSYTVAPDPNGSFVCPCPHHPAPVLYPDVQQFVAHIKVVCNWTNLPAPVRILSNQLVDAPVLASYSLVINIAYHLLICTSCAVVIFPAQLDGHLQSKHQTNVDATDIPLLHPFFSFFSVLSTFPSLASPMDAIEGLPVCDGLQCAECVRCYTTEVQLQRHFREQHPLANPPESWAKVFLQHLSNGAGSGRSYFAVIPKPITQTPLDELLSVLKMSYTETPEADTEPISEARLLTPWLRHTRWHELLSGHKPEELRALAAHPKVNELPSLQPAVYEVFVRASGRIDETSVLILQKIHSPQPDKEITNAPFTHLQNHMEELRNYIRPITSLIAMLLRGVFVPLPGEIPQQISALERSLGTGTLDEVIAHIEVLLQNLWTRTWLPSKDHRITDPTLLYLALSSILPEGSFKEAKNITNVIARFQYCMRLFAIGQLHLAPTPEGGYQEWAPWLTEKLESSFNSLRTLQHLATSITYGTMSPPRIYWTDRRDFSSMLYKGDPISLPRIQAMLGDNEQMLKNIWERELLFSLDISVQYSSIKDDISNMTPGYGFVTDRRNDCFSDPFILLSQIIRIPQLRNQFIASVYNGQVVWKMHALRTWLVTYARFHLALLTRANLTAGAPSRITEITGMQITNTPQYPLRNLVAMGNHIVLLVTYLKTSSLTGFDRLIPHSLDAFSSDLLVQDLAIARPFARLAAQVCHQGQPGVQRLYHNYLFVNHTSAFDTDNVTNALRSMSAPHFDRPFGVNGWRHISTAFRRMKCGRVLDLVEDEGQDTIQALQSGHKRKTENRVYGRSTDALAGEPEDVLPLFLDASTDWQTVCRVVPGGLVLPYRSAMMSFFDKLSAKGKIAEVEPPLRPVTREYVDAQIGLLRTDIKQLHDALVMQVSDVPMARNIKEVPGSSQSSGEISLSTTLVEDNVTGTSCSVNVPSDDECLAMLRRVLGDPQASWTCPEQLTGIQALLALENDVLTILPTGSGKTMLVIIPSMLEKNKITVVILPLRALMMDYKNKLERMKIPYELFDAAKPLAGAANLILVSADAVKTVEWKQSIGELAQRIPVVRQIFDESHIPATSNNYRPALLHMSDIRCVLPTQIVLLSATVPLHMEPFIIQDFGFGENHVVIRTPTNRPELEYRWMGSMRETELPELIRRFVANTIKKSEDRGLIFVPFKALGTLLANIMKYPFYHGGQELADDSRAALYADWKSGRSPIMVCTSAFGTGNDHAHVRLVVHAGTPFEMLDYTQEVSRAGRDQQPALCVLLPTALHNAVVEGPDLCGKHYLQDALAGSSKCIRYRITFFNDGVGMLCSESGANQACSVCAAKANKIKPPVTSEKRSHTAAFDLAAEASSKRLRSRNSEKQKYIADFQEQLSRLQNTCTLCLVYDVDSPHHNITRCPTLKAKGGFGAYKAWRTSLQYSYDGICWKCQIPNGPHDTLHPPFNSGLPCEYPDLIAPMVYAALSKKEVCASASTHFGQPLQDQTEALPWLVGKVIAGHYSNLTAFFLWYAGAH